LRILKLLREQNVNGMTMPEIIAAMDAERSAVQRALDSLIEEGFVERSPSRRYHLGVEAMHLGRATMLRSPLVSTYRQPLQRIARTTGHTAFIGVRMGDFILCLHREEGSAPMRAKLTRAGELKPLGTTAGSLALMANMRERDIHTIYQRHVSAYEAARLDFEALCQHVRHVKRTGYGVIHDSVSEGVTGIGVGLGGTEPFATVSVAGPTSLLGPKRLTQLYAELRKVADEAV
jgi:DNA-binding IclR family transcriptional regulator